MTRGGPKHPASLRGPWALVAAALAATMTAAIMLGTDRAGLPRIVAVVAGICVGMLTVAGLPSVPTRVAVTAVIAMGGFVVARHARLAGVDGVLVLAWAVGAVVTLILADRADLVERPSLARDAPRRSFPRATVGALLAVLLVAAALAPAISASLHRDVRTGTSADPFADPGQSVLSFSDTLDTRTRPRLSDRVVMTVDAERPAFWRGQTYDMWDGTRWTRSTGLDYSRLHYDNRGLQAIPAPADDPGASTGISNRQTFTVEAPFADVMFAAASPRTLLSDRPALLLPDGTLALPEGESLGTGATYTVTSREANATQATLRASGALAVPSEIDATYARPSTTTDRVRVLARSITAGAPTSYDKVLAIEAWLAKHTRYSLDAPLPPTSSTDVVDWFTFTSHEGWCEQIASTLVVMLREVGVPARLATGFVPGDLDLVSNRYTVRERDAHAWADVYFPGVGWQGFDPTANVPLAGEAHHTQTLWQMLRSHAVLIVIVVGALGGLFLAGPLLARVARRPPRRAPSWAEETWRSLADVGGRVGRPPSAADTPRAFARAVASETGADDLVGVGELVDAAVYGGYEPSAAQRERAAAALALARSAPARE